MSQTHGANAFKLFTAIIKDGPYKLVFFQPSLLFVGKAGSLLQGGAPERVIVIEGAYNEERSESSHKIVYTYLGSFTIKHYRFIMHGFRSKLVCLFKLMIVTGSIKGTSLLQNPSCFVNYEFVMFYRTRPDVLKRFCP